MSLTTTRQMLGAEILKLWRNRALLACAFVLAVVTVAIFFGYNAIEHSSNPGRYAPAGGTHNFGDAVRVLGLFFGALAAILIGSEAGTADLSSGVFRDLVATGRSRLALFALRAPAALVVTLVFTGAGFLVALAGTFLFAGGLPTPSASLILQSAGWIILANAIMVSLAVGVGSLTGSRAVTLTAVIGWQVVATQLLVNVSSLGSARDLLLTSSLSQLMPVPGRLDIVMATGVAVAVLAGWFAIPAALGAWRTQTQDA
jgi:hypothetical protein